MIANTANAAPLQLPGAQRPEYFTARAGARIARVTPQTIRSEVQPDAILRSERGDKKYGLYTRQTLEAFAASRAARNLQVAPQAHDAR